MPSEPLPHPSVSNNIPVHPYCLLNAWVKSLQTRNWRSTNLSSFRTKLLELVSHGEQFVTNQNLKPKTFSSNSVLEWLILTQKGWTDFTHTSLKHKIITLSLLKIVFFTDMWGKVKLLRKMHVLFGTFSTEYFPFFFFFFFSRMV